MDVWPVILPSTGSQQGGHVFRQLQQPTDGQVSVGSGRLPQWPPFNVAPEFKQARGVLAVDSGHSGTKPLNKIPPGPAPGDASSPCHLTYDEMMIRCTQLMEQLINQQLQFQLALSATECAMAAAPSSFVIHPEQKTQQPVAVMSAARCDQGLIQLSDLLSSAKVCHEAPGSPLLPVHTVLTTSISTSQQIVSPALPLQTRAPAASEDGLQSAGEKISDVTSDDHHPRKLVQVGNQLDQHRETDEEDSFNRRFQTKHANPFSYQTTEAPASPAAQNDIPAIIIDQHHEQFNKVEACANGSLHLFIASGKQRTEQGKSVATVDQCPPWPPPAPAAYSLMLDFVKFRGGRKDFQSFWILSLDKFINQPNVCSTINPHLKQVNCGSNRDARERPLRHSLCHQLLVVPGSLLTSAIIPNMITSPVPELPEVAPLSPILLTPPLSTSEPAVQPRRPHMRHLCSSRINNISNGYIYHTEYVGAKHPYTAGTPLRRSG